MGGNDGCCIDGTRDVDLDDDFGVAGDGICDGGRAGMLPRRPSYDIARPCGVRGGIDIVSCAGRFGGGGGCI